MQKFFMTTWKLDGDTLSPDMSGEPEPPHGFYRSSCSSYVPEKYTPQDGEPVIVYLSYEPIAVLVDESGEPVPTE